MKKIIKKISKNKEMIMIITNILLVILLIFFATKNTTNSKQIISNQNKTEYQIKQLNESLKATQSQVMKMSSQIYRIQATTK